VALTLVLVSGRSSSAQSVRLPELKAAFLVNFARCAEWPEAMLPPGGAIVLCVAGADEVADALEPAVRSRSVNSHDLKVRRLALDSEPLPCHLLYVGGDRQGRAVAAASKPSAERLGTLTVGDAIGFAQSGGTAALVAENGKLRIAVNLEALNRSTVRLSSRLLGLATIVKDVPAP
jgi:hypothetical protein